MKDDTSEPISGVEAAWVLGTCTKSNELVLAPSYKEGAFDSHAVDCPFVFRHGDEYRMTFVGWDSTGYRTGWARSEDLRHWVNMGLLIDRGPKGSPTEYNVALTSILRDNDMLGDGRLQMVDGRYVGTYHTYPSPGYEQGPGAIGLCYSTDLMEWQLDEPVLLAKDGKDWERGGLYKSWIMQHDSMFYLFYNAKNRTEGRWFEQTGMAYSSDLGDWTRHPANPVLLNGPDGAFDERFASDPCILNASGTWYAFYFGLCSDGHARDGIATSDDLITWTQTHQAILDVGPDGSVDSRHAHKPAVIWSGERLFHFYCAVADASHSTRQMGEIVHSAYRGISYATWDGPRRGSPPVHARRRQIELHIRPAECHDVDSLVRVTVSAFEPIFISFNQTLGPQIYSKIYPDWRMIQQREVKSAWTNRKIDMWVAEVEGTVIGLIAYELRDDQVGEVHLLAVHPDFQNDGVGTELSNFALRMMRDAGMVMAEVATGGDESHAPARSTYEKTGYTALPLVRYYKWL